MKAHTLALAAPDWATACTMQTLFAMDGHPAVALRGTACGVPGNLVLVITSEAHADLVSVLAPVFAQLPPDKFTRFVNDAKRKCNAKPGLSSAFHNNAARVLYAAGVRVLDPGSVLQSQGGPEPEPKPNHDPGDEHRDPSDNWKPAR